MKSFRVFSTLFSLALAAALAWSQGNLDRRPKPGNGGGSPPSQGPSKPNNPPSKPDLGPRPGGGGGNQGPKPDVDRPRPKPEEKPQPVPEFKPRPKPEEKPQPIPEFKPRPKPEEKPQPTPDLRPRPRPDDPKPQPGNDDNLRPRPRPGGGNSGPGGGNGGNSGNNDVPRIGNRPGQGSQPGGGWTLDSPIGRINNGSSNNGRQGDSQIGRRGGNSYGGSISNNNRGDNRSSRPDIARAPIDVFRGGLDHQVRREDNVRIANRWRSGYYHYRRDWCDDYFWFNWYVFDPFRSTNCFVSPWYYYHHLPGYVSNRCATVVTINLSPWYGTPYNWYRPTRYDDWRKGSDLDYALEDITRAFEYADKRALRRLLPYRDRVAIFVDGRYNYSMTAEDFESFMIDAIEGTDTRRYEIIRVDRRGNEVEVQARHDYNDPWGNRESVYHWYRLEGNREGYVITRFGTSYYRN